MGTSEGTVLIYDWCGWVQLTMNGTIPRQVVVKESQLGAQAGKSH